jgi:hypothetical protein
VYEEDLVDLEDGIRRLKVEYDIFFNGNRKKPPDDLRFRVERLIRKLSESNLTFQERFRYNTQVARFYVYRDFWRRNQSELELAAGARRATGSGRAASAATSSRPAEHGISVAITDPGKEEEKVRSLYDALLQIRSRGAKDAPDVSYQQFAKYIESQTRGIRAKSGCASVIFTLAVREDAIKFMARAGKKTD